MINKFYDHNEIPKDWELSKLKYIFEFSNETSDDYESQKNLSLTKKGIIEKNIELNEGQIAKDYKNYIFIKKNQICMNPMDLLSGWVDISPTDGLISPAYYTLIPKENYDVKFLNYFLQSNYYRETFFSIGKGVASHDNYGRWVLTPEEFKNFFIYLPTLNEQKIISNYLEKKTQKIKLLVNRIQKKIELLKEQRTSLINHHVTKGLDQNVELKESYVNWIGQIPKHWTVKKVKYLGSIKSGEGITAQDFLEGGDYKVFGGNGVVGFFNQFNVDKTVIVIGRVGEKCGNIHLVKEKSWISDNSLILELFNPEYYDWISLALESRDLNLIRNQSSQPLITGTQIKNESIPMPPKNELTKISSFIQSSNLNLFEKIKKETKRIELLQEYHQSLISSLVTGKIRVTKDNI